MILSEQARRWSEIQFYYICLDLYHLRQNMIDVIIMLEAISQIAETNFTKLKIIAGKILGDPAYLPNKNEVISIAYAMNMSKMQIHKIFNISRPTIDAVLNSERNIIRTPFPQFELTEDEEMHKFVEVFNKLKKVGI